MGSNRLDLGTGRISRRSQVQQGTDFVDREAQFTGASDECQDASFQRPIQAVSTPRPQRGG